MHRDVFGILTGIKVGSAHILSVFTKANTVKLRTLDQNTTRTAFLSGTAYGLVHRGTIGYRIRGETSILPNSIDHSLTGLTKGECSCLFVSPPCKGNCVSRVLTLVFTYELPTRGTVVVTRRSVRRPPSVAYLRRGYSM